MKKFLLLVICFSVFSILHSQETKKQKEVGLVFSNLDNFGLTYRSGTANSLFRLNTLFISGANIERSSDSLTTNLFQI